jgi:hypothetical protein
MTLTDEKARPVFIIGCPRSGTTWLQLLLAQHPAIASSQETHLFSRYIARLFESWHYEKQTNQSVGLCTILTDAEFRQICRDMSNTVLQRIQNEKPDATIILEKTPDQVFCIDTILDLYPNATIINLIRDPRAVVASLLAASRSWGSSWAPANTFDAAMMWGNALRQGKASAERTNNYKEIHYESLAENTVEVLQELIQWLDLPTEPSFYEQAVKTCARSDTNTSKDESNIPPSLREELSRAKRKGRTDSWRQELTATQIRIVEYVALDQMRTYGYKPHLNPQGNKPLRASLHNGARSVWASLSWRLEKMIQKI